jgi:transcriptional regulator with AAA-type ATPase domain/NAD-dependent dihydropyrimidine dehydrogenase PreA subunit
MSFPDLITWLQERSALSILPQEVLMAIAPLLQTKTIPPYQDVIIEGTEADGLYILREGHIESNSKIARSVGLLCGSVINLQAILLKQPVQQSITTIDESQFYFIEPDNFQHLVSRYPEITQIFSKYLAERVENLSSQLVYEQERQLFLRPYLVSRAKKGIIGKSRYAVRLRDQVQKAARNRKSVLIFGEPGLEKDDLGALIHFGSGDRKEPIIKINCSKIQTSGADLFGRAFGKPGLIEALGKGTLIFNNIQDLEPKLLPPILHFIETGTYRPISFPGELLDEEKSSPARIITIAEKSISELETLSHHVIKVPPLRVRKPDIDDLVDYYISIICRNRCLEKPRITPEALRKLQAYDFPNNQRELENLVERAMRQLQGGFEITEEIIWPSQSKKKQFRWNLLNAYPQLRIFLRSNWWPERINYGFTAAFFAFIVIILFVGPQTRSQNFALNLFWAWWWPLILIGFPFVGRLWCSVCPFMIYGEIFQKVSVKLFPRQLKKWPREKAEAWGGWFLYIGFALILLWEELGNLEDTAYLSAWLLLLITGGAIICSVIFERRFWCRYLCPIGGMNGMFAKLSMTELRAQQGICSAECNTYQCYKGGPEKGEGKETEGCPLYSHPAQLEDNRDCVLCMTCLKACPHRSVEFNLRPPGIELWTSHLPRSYEVALLFLLCNTVFLHHLPQINQQLGLNLDLTNFWIHGLFALATLSLPTVFPWVSHKFVVFLHQRENNLKTPKFWEIAYGYLPLVLAGNLAHYWYLFLNEAGRILPVSLATFGLSSLNLPILIVHPAVINFISATTLIIGVILSIVLTQKIARQSFKLFLSQHLVIILSAWAMYCLIYTNIYN